MDLRQLRYFVAIVEQGSFSKAALMLHVAQPALSLHVRNMEADFGATLLVRSPQGVKPTEAGIILLRDAKAIIQQFEATRQEIRERDADPQGNVRIGMTATMSAVLGAPLLLEVRRRHPRIKLRIAEAMSGFLLEWLREGRVDIGVVYKSVEEHGLTSTSMASEELVLVSAAEPPDGCGFRDQNEVSMDQVATVPLLLPSAGHGLRDVLGDAAEAAEQRLNVIIDIDSPVCLQQLIEDRVGYSVLPSTAVQRDVAAGRLRRWRIGSPALSRPVYLVHSSERPLASAVGAVVDLCAVMLPRFSQEATDLSSGGAVQPEAGPSPTTSELTAVAPEPKRRRSGG